MLDDARVCRVCTEVKTAAGFYKCNKGICKGCIIARVKRRARTNPKVQEYDRVRAKRPHVAARIRKTAAEWAVKNPDARKAHTALNNAVRDGKVTKEPCLFCAAENVHAHHRDYSAPLDVVWLCPQCHMRLHAAFPETEGAHKNRRE